jgi:hypothetical protein
VSHFHLTLCLFFKLLQHPHLVDLGVLVPLLQLPVVGYLELRHPRLVDMGRHLLVVACLGHPLLVDMVDMVHPRLVDMGRHLQVEACLEHPLLLLVDMVDIMVHKRLRRHSQCQRPPRLVRSCHLLPMKYSRLN